MTELNLFTKSQQLKPENVTSKDMQSISKQLLLTSDVGFQAGSESESDIQEILPNSASESSRLSSSLPPRFS